MSLRTLLILLLAPYAVYALEVVIMDYSDVQTDTITVYDYTKKESEPLESEDNVYTQDQPVQELYEYHYIFPLYEE